MRRNIDTSHHWWEANRNNNAKRIKAYTIPGVSEVIYRDEWKNKNYNTESNTNIAPLVILLLAGIIVAVYIIIRIVFNV